MQPFSTHTGVVIPFDRRNVDTDAILPKQYLKMLEKTGFGDFLFDDERYLDPGDVETPISGRRPNPAFILNQPPYDKGSILLARDNFGCGSSREHAVWGLVGFGIRVVIAPSFGEIFYNNCINNGLLPVILKLAAVEELFQCCREHPGFELTVDLENQTLSHPARGEWPFHMEDGHRKALLEGLDEIGLTLERAEAIRAFEASRREREPWLFTE
ncbi:3-isopropylmalate dehydratase small subunit [Vreelandella utahensis]|uniref:3-isopropylmalate dehydratase small subunit n=1 Tax=Vreelandella halophila TaxID=86177 RepID=UPI0009866BB0|nr:3-isopropylmalate dehydratase small subunit [Halomonas utahensis]